MFALIFAIGLYSSFAATIQKVSQLPGEIPAIAKNKFSKEAILLGEKLFFDAALSSTGQRSCSSCHIPANSFASRNIVDPGDFEVGIRNTPVLINRYFSSRQMWDGRADSLEQQIWMPIQNAAEMGSKPEAVLQYLNTSAEYSKLFQQSFGEKATEKNVAQALSQFVLSNFAAGSRYDEFIKGNKKALSTDEISGLKLFRDKFKCVSCHSGFNFTNESISERCARSESYFAKNGPYVQKYKVPTLRNLQETAPYFHNGKLPTIASVIEFYQGCQVIGEDGNALKGKYIRMSAKEKNELESFLKSLNSRIYQYRP